MTFPRTRPRRLRRNQTLRSMVRETRLSRKDLILPLFVVEGSGVREPVASMPGVFRYSVEPKGGESPEPMTADVYSIFEGAPHVGQLRQAYRDMSVRLRGGSLELGGHAMADELRALGVGPRPLMSTWAGHRAFEMSAPEKL